jgi:hypothetical protein
MLKQVEKSSVPEKRKDVDVQQIVVGIRASAGTDVSGMKAKTNKFNKKYKFYFSVDRQIFSMEYIWSTDMKKGLTPYHVNP